MTSSQALSAHFPTTADSEAARHGLRAADLIDSPVRWPVHQLQKLYQADFDAGESEMAELAARADKAPGWMRLMLPLSLSIVLWAQIFWFVGMLR